MIEIRYNGDDLEYRFTYKAPNMEPMTWKNLFSWYAWIEKWSPWQRAERST